MPISSTIMNRKDLEEFFIFLIEQGWVKDKVNLSSQMHVKKDISITFLVISAFNDINDIIVERVAFNKGRNMIFEINLPTIKELKFAILNDERINKICFEEFYDEQTGV